MNKIKIRSTGTRFLALLLVLLMAVSLLPLTIFAASATDGKPEDGETSDQPFIAGQTGGSNNNSFRIPAMVTLNDGTIVAAADARWTNAYDCGGNDTIVSYSKDNGKTWKYTFANYMGDNNYTYTLDSATFIDPALVTDGKNVYMMVDLYAHGVASNTAGTLSNGSGFNSDGYLKLAAKGTTAYTYYLKDGKIYDSTNTLVDGYTVDAYFNITGPNETSSNLFYADSPYQVYPTGYLYFTKSVDGGAKWSEPMLLNFNADNEKACLIGAGQGVVTDKGTIVFTFYDFNSSSQTTKLGFIFSTDGGVTWNRINGYTGNGTESTIVKLDDGTLRVFYRHTSGDKVSYIDVTETSKGVFSWGSAKTTTATDLGTCQRSAMKYSKTVNGHEVIIVSCPTESNRTVGYLYLFDANDMSLLGDYRVTSGNFQYSALAELNDGRIAHLYETQASTATVNGSITFATYDPAEIFSNVTFDEVSNSSDDIVSDLDSENIKIYAGSTTTKTYTFSSDVSVESGSNTDQYASVSWTVENVAAVPGTEGTYEKVTSPESGESYLIKCGNYYLKLNGSDVEYTTNANEATSWTFTTANSGFYIKSGSYYLTWSNYRNNYLYLSTSTRSGTDFVTNGNGIYYTSNRNSYYLYYSSNSTNPWRFSTSTSTKSYPYQYVPGTEGTEAYSKVTLTATGIKVGVTSPFTVGNKSITVEVVDVPVGWQRDVSLAVNETESLTLPVTPADGQKVVWSSADNTYFGFYTTSGNTNATLYGREAGGPVVLTAIVYNEDGTIAGTYYWNVTVTNGTKHNVGSYTVTYTFTDNKVYNGKLYYSVNGGPLQEPEYTESIENGDTVRTYSSIVVEDQNVAWSQIEWFVAPDDGYAVTSVQDPTGKTYSQFCAINETDGGFNVVYADNHQGAKLSGVLTDEQEYALLAEAKAKGCDAVFWNTRGTESDPLSANDTSTGSYYAYCDKLPTIDKGAYLYINVLTNTKLDISGNADDIIANVGDKVVFKITVSLYKETAAITYTNGKLIDNMEGITLYSDSNLTNELTKSSDGTYNIISTLDADRVNATSTQYAYYYAVYTLTENDLKEGRVIINTAGLSYTYKSVYSSSSRESSANAGAKFMLTDFPNIDAIVVDYGLPVVVYNGVKWAENYSASTITVKSATASYGDVAFTGDNQTGLTVTYTPNGILKDVDEIKLTSSRGNTSTIRVIPASTVYYEDSFVSFTNGTGATWADVGDTQDAEQTLSVLGSKDIYGFDSAYASSTEFSLGSAKKVTVSSAILNNWDDSSSKWPTATFTFKGTGFDLISLTDNDSGLITYTITDKAENVVRQKFVSNYYGYTYDAENKAWSKTNDGENALYQIPVLMERDLTYGEYTVTVTVAYSKMFDKTGDNQYSFWFDAIRIYDTLGSNYDEYAEDNEAYPLFFELRDALADTDNYSAVLIEGTTEAEQTDYKAIGPNHEVYLAPGQSIAFKLNCDNSNKIATVQLGAKAIDGAAEFTIGDKATTVNTATDMYYNITANWKNAEDGIIIIQNTGNNILSLTQVKVTRTDKFSNVTLGMTEQQVQAAVYAVRAMFAMPAEPETFEPETFKASFSPVIVKEGKTATLTVTASEEVEAILVDGEEVDSYRTRTVTTGWGSNRTTVTYHVFTYTVTATETADYSIVAVNADGAVSEEITATLTVWQGFGNWFKDIIGRFF